MKEIPLTQGKVALVDDEDYEWLSQWKWYANKNHNTYYAMRSVTKNGRRIKILLHQEILGKKLGYIIDHKNGNGLHNQRENLRHVTYRQNTQNMHTPKSSKYPGVSWNKQKRKWMAYITIDSKMKYIGYYTKEVDAFRVYQAFVKESTSENVIGY